MSDQELQHEALISQLKDHLTRACYSEAVITQEASAARCFLRYLRQRQIDFETVQPAHVGMYLRYGLRRYVRRRGHAPRCLVDWRSHHTSGIYQLLRLIKGGWPPSPPPRNPFEAFSQALCAEFTQWLDLERGLAPETIEGSVAEAQRFLSWYGERAAPDTLQTLGITDIDAYVQARAPGLRRVSRKGLAQQLRRFMRFAHATGRTSRDFAGAVMAPTLYALESIPSALSPQQVEAVLQTCRADHSPKALRDYAIVLLLATYGVRAGEIARLRLEDVDWSADRLRVRHSKTGAQSLLPLLPAVGRALLAYLRRGRPRTQAREFFIRAHAPYRGFRSGSSLYGPIRARLEAAGVQSSGKRGPHAFRHARAMSLLRAGVAPKVIGDLLGHRSAASVTAYLKLSTDELREVALEIGELLEGGVK